MNDLRNNQELEKMENVCQVQTQQLQQPSVIATGKKKQRGFTMVELLMVLVAIGLLIWVMNSGLFQSQEDAKAQTAKTQLLKDFPRGIATLVSFTNKCTNTTITRDKLISRGVPSETVWGGAWSVTTSGGNTVTVTYPLDLKDTDLGAQVADALLRSDNIKTATGTGTQIVVSYRCN